MMVPMENSRFDAGNKFRKAKQAKKQAVRLRR